MKQLYFFILYFIVLASLTQPATAQIRGHIFRDMNANCSFNEGTEQVLLLIRVNAYDQFLILLDSG